MENHRPKLQSNRKTFTRTLRYNEVLNIRLTREKSWSNLSGVVWKYLQNDLSFPYIFLTRVRHSLSRERFSNIFLARFLLRCFPFYFIFVVGKREEINDYLYSCRHYNLSKFPRFPANLISTYALSYVQCT